MWPGLIKLFIQMSHLKPEWKKMLVYTMAIAGGQVGRVVARATFLQTKLACSRHLQCAICYKKSCWVSRVNLQKATHHCKNIIYKGMLLQYTLTANLVDSCMAISVTKPKTWCIAYRRPILVLFNVTCTLYIAGTILVGCGMLPNLQSLNLFLRVVG